MFLIILDYISLRINKLAYFVITKALFKVHNIMHAFWICDLWVSTNAVYTYKRPS